jgi:hypothetical protein
MGVWWALEIPALRVMVLSPGPRYSTKAVTVAIERRASRQPMPLASVTRFKAPKERATRWMWIGVAGGPWSAWSWCSVRRRSRFGDGVSVW